jgi:hypothetical protein
MDCVKRDRSTAPQQEIGLDHAARALLARALTSPDIGEMSTTMLLQCVGENVAGLVQASYSKSPRLGFSEW